MSKPKAPSKHIVAGAIWRKGSTIPARPTPELNLTKEEMAMLPDPNWVTEDDADAIMSIRSEREGGAIPLEDVLKEIRERRLAR